MVARASLLAVAIASALARRGGDDTADAAALVSPQALQVLVWKYTARCALRPDQALTVDDDGAAGGSKRSLPGEFGLAPDWRDGDCDERCQERVSSCLLALMNRTGKHVPLSLLGGAAMGRQFAANDADIAFPHQEGAFFGNVFSGAAYACRGRAAGKAADVGRTCALEPATCGGLIQLQDAGACDDACEMACAKLSDGGVRCAATACTDPTGHRWPHPLTTYVRDTKRPNRQK